MLFFIHKKDNTNDPNNYRSISIQNPILKCFTHIIAEKISKYAEDENLLPNYQFAYRKKRSTIGAVSLMTNSIDSRLNREKSKSQRTYAAYIDFKKCFDSVNREKLFQCLIQKGILIQICKIIS